MLRRPLADYRLGAGIVGTTAAKQIVSRAHPWRWREEHRAYRNSRARDQ